MRINGNSEGIQMGLHEFLNLNYLVKLESHREVDLPTLEETNLNLVAFTFPPPANINSLQHQENAFSSFSWKVSV